MTSTAMNENPGTRPTILCETPACHRHQWIWWIFSLYYFIPAFYYPFSWTRHSLILGAYLLFLFLCFVTASSRRIRAWQPIAGIIILACATAYITSGASSFFSYAGFFIGFCFTIRLFVVWLIAIVLIIVALHFHFHYPIPHFLFPALTGVGTIGLVGVIERMRFQAKIKEQQSHQEIRQLAMIAERERIARDLHDILGHTLSSVVLKAELADKLLQQNHITEARQHMEDLHKIARESLSLVRQTVSGYKHRGLSGEVIQLCEKLRESGFTVELTGEVPQVSAKAETALILALTELTTNIMRHSDGNHCALIFDQAEGTIRVSVSDNGSIKSLTPGNGLQGIEERMQTLAGQLFTDLKDGCRFVITLPEHQLTQAQ